MFGVECDVGYDVDVEVEFDIGFDYVGVDCFEYDVW